MSDATLAAARERIAQLASTGASTADALAEVLATARTAMERSSAPAQPRAPGAAGQRANLEALMDAIAASVKTHYSQATAPLIARLEALEKARTMTFHGPHDPAKQYEAGDVVQRSKACWVAMVDTTASPGDSADWRRLAWND